MKLINDSITFLFTGEDGNQYKVIFKGVLDSAVYCNDNLIGKYNHEDGHPDEKKARHVIKITLEQ